MIEDENEEGKRPGTGTVVQGLGRAAEQDSPTISTDDIKADLRAGLRRRPKSTGAVPETDAATDAHAPAALRDPLKTAYVIVGVSALLTAAGSALLLHQIGGPHLGPNTRWLAPLAGSGLFALLGVLLARSSVVRPQ